MKHEKSCGAVVFTRIDGEIKYVLAQASGGHYGFPKGHVEEGETETDTALREIFEEVHLRPSFLAGFREISTYYIPDWDIQKQVVFFLGQYEDQKIVPAENELLSAPLVSYEEAMALLTHEENKRILKAAHDFLSARPYYSAYDDRYRQVHGQDLQWFYDNPTQIVMQTIKDFGINHKSKLLEIGCGEGRDAYPLLKEGFDLLATDVSDAAIRFCQKKFPEFAPHFQVLDCVAGEHSEKFDFIFAVAVVHMLVTDADRNAFYRFIREHLTDNGIALICTMGDGQTERQTDPRTAFLLQDRIHEQTGKAVQIASTSCRMVTFETLNKELLRNGLAVLKEGITSVPPDFSQLMYAVINANKEKLL